jgi:hypothetical protein
VRAVIIKGRTLGPKCGIIEPLKKEWRAGEDNSQVLHARMSAKMGGAEVKCAKEWKMGWNILKILRRATNVYT